jgi:hypothetical protein
MTEYDNTNTGAIFKNDRREEGTKQPEYNGSLNVEGVEYWLSAWVKESKTGKKFFSVAIKRKEPKQRPTGGMSSLADDMDDSIPF